MTYHNQPQKTYTSQNYLNMMWKMLAILNWHVLFAGPLSGITELKRSETTLLNGPSLLLCWTLKLGGMSSDRDTYKRKYKLWKNHWCYPQITTKRTRMPHSASLMPTKKSCSVWTLKSTISAARNGGSKEICPLDSNKEPLWHTEKIPTGISANGYARTVQAVVFAVVEAVTVVKNREQVAFGVPRLKWDHAHCTSACGCCIRTLGYTEDQIDKKRDSEDFPFDISLYETAYDHRLLRAYIFGLSFLDALSLARLLPLHYPRAHHFFCNCRYNRSHCHFK